MRLFAWLHAAGRRRRAPVAGPATCRHTAAPAAGLVMLGLLLAGCGGDDGSSKPKPPVNDPPQIVAINANPRLVLTHMPVRASVTARDSDNRILRHSWSATRGTFGENPNQASVSWLSPDDPGVDSLTVRVTDSHDTVSAAVRIEVRVVKPPTALLASAGTSICDLRWTASGDDGADSTWRGYEIYQAPRSFAGIPPDSVAAYRIAGPITGASYRASGLARGTIYHFCVGAVRAWAGYEERSSLTPDVDIAPRAEWTKQLQEIRNPAGGLAIDLSAGEVRPVDPAGASGNAVFAVDLYLGTSDPLDGPGPASDPAAPRIKSVSLLANRNPEWARHRVWVKRLGSDWSVSTVSDDGWGEEADLEPGGVYAVKTTERNFAKLLVADLPTAVSPYRQLTVKWAYQSIPGYPGF